MWRISGAKYKELREEVSRLCSIRRDEKKVDWIFSDTLQVQKPGPCQRRTGQPMFVELGNGDSCDDEDWKSVTCGSRPQDYLLALRLFVGDATSIGLH